MPCHGDKGQGLTDEWRAVWESDHQDCWGRGCHTGKSIEDSFSIPTVVPSIVGSGKLARFTSLEALSDFLKTTHPPQNPGWLTDEQYRNIALYIFSENDRSLVEPTLTPILFPTPIRTQISETMSDEEPRQGNSVALYVGFGFILFFVSIWAIRKTREP